MSEIEEVTNNPDSVDTIDNDVEECAECNTNVATGMYLNICKEMEEEGKTDINCEKLFDDMVDGKITRDDLLTTIREGADPHSIELLDTVDALEHGEDLGDLGPENNVEV